jgi:serine/threonine-protein kinase ULK/ATG1
MSSTPSSGSVLKRSVGDYYVTKKIGSGSFASVWKGYSKYNTAQWVAIKSINREKINLNKKHQENLESEIAIMQKIQHRNCVKMYTINSTERHIYIILEYCAGGDLSKYLRKYGSVYI